MVYFDYSQNRYVSSQPTLIPDIRAHLANWRQFRSATRSWPILSMISFLLRFVIIISGVVAALWYGVGRHDWMKDEYFVISLAVLLPILFGWYLVECLAWNHDVRRKGIAKNSDIWGVKQFPPT